MMLSHKSHLPYLITTGDPAGVGMDIVLSALSDKRFLSSLNDSLNKFVLSACLTALQKRATDLYKLGKLPNMPAFESVHPDEIYEDWVLKALDDKCIWVIDTPCMVPPMAGKPTPKNAMMIKNQLDIAHELAIEGRVKGMITAPLAKSVMIEGGICLDNGELFCGHTEYFMGKCGLDKVVMMLANQSMKVALVTTHIPLKKVADAITQNNLQQTVEIVYHSLKHQFGISDPKILVCGLNPHAGEGGHLGDEEQNIINPVLRHLQNKGMAVSLALPADTIFTPAMLKNADVVVAMYHDQGLAPLKSHGFGETVNITLGLPYVRTSVDHGTAFDLAGTGQASAQSLKHAIDYAIQMSGSLVNQSVIID